MKKRFLFLLLVTISACSQPQIESKTPITSAVPTTIPETPIPTTSAAPTTIPETSTSATIEPETTSEALATPTPTASEEDTTESVDKPATLTSVKAGSRINVRSRASTNAKVRYRGFAGDSVTILREVTGDDGNTWYRVKFAKGDKKGWVRSDFVTTSTDETTPLPTSSPSPTSTPEN